MKYPTRCKIIDVSGKEIFPGIFAQTPEASRPHIGKLGLAEKEGPDVRIILDDGNILMGYECWWEPITTGWREVVVWPRGSGKSKRVLAKTRKTVATP